MHYYEKFPQHRQWPLKFRKMHLPRIPILAHDTPVVNLGSCFGETLQHFLDMYHFNIIESQAGYKYSCHSILREVSCAAQGLETTPEMLFLGQKGYTDFNHHRIFDIDKTAFLRKINIIERNVRKSLSKAEIVILTPSLTEVWRNRRTGEFILHPYPGVMRDSGEFEVEFLTTADNIAHLDEIRHKLLGFNPNIKIIANVCPTPLRVTHKDADIIQGNNTSKSTLYAAIQEFCNKHDNTFYFPGYDIVFNDLAGSKFYIADNRHLTHSALQYYMQCFSSMFCTDDSIQIMITLEELHTAPPHKQMTLLQSLSKLGYDSDLLLIKMANAFLANGDNKSAFDSLCQVSLLPESPAICLNLGLLLLEFNLRNKATDFFVKALNLLQDISFLAFDITDRSQRVRLGDSHMFPQRNISDQREQTLSKMKIFAENLILNNNMQHISKLKKLIFCDTLSHNMFPFGIKSIKS